MEFTIVFEKIIKNIWKIDKKKTENFKPLIPHNIIIWLLCVESYEIWYLTSQVHVDE